MLGDQIKSGGARGRKNERLVRFRNGVLILT